MKRALTKSVVLIYHYVDGKRIDGPPSGVCGNLTGVRGDLSDCGITDDDRENGIDIDDLIKGITDE